MAGLTATDYTGDAFYQEHVASGIDYLVCGNWQLSYARMVTDATLQHTYASPAMLDAGCACGALLSAFGRTGIYELTLGIDASAAMVRMGREKFGFDDRLQCGSIADLSFIPNDLLTLVSSSQVLEHVGDDIIDDALAEFYRVLDAGGRMFHHYDALKHGDALNAYDFDPTHVNIKPQFYWNRKFVEAGFVPDFEALERFARSTETTGGNGAGETFHHRYRNWSVSAWIKP